MAAADYYNPGSGQQPAPPQPRPPQQNLNLNPNPPYPTYDGPPPAYTPFSQEQRPHSQPPPQHRPPPGEQYYAPPPSGLPPNVNTHQYPEKIGRPVPQVHPMYKPADFNGGYAPQQGQQQPQYQQAQGYFPLSGTPAMQQVYGSGSVNGRRPSTTPGYKPSSSPYRDESRSRSRSRSRSQHRRHHRPQVQRKKSSGVNTFLGAGGGAILGDAIFPGLGTLGGAILGGFGGHEYGKSKGQRRPQSNPTRARGRAYSNDGDDYYNDDHRRGRKY